MERGLGRNQPSILDFSLHNCGTTMFLLFLKLPVSTAAQQSNVVKCLFQGLVPVSICWTNRWMLKQTCTVAWSLDDLFHGHCLPPSHPYQGQAGMCAKSLSHVPVSGEPFRLALVSPVHRIPPGKWVAMTPSREYLQPRDRTRVLPLYH